MLAFSLSSSVVLRSFESASFRNAADVYLSSASFIFLQSKQQMTHGSTAPEKSTASTSMADSDWTHSFIERTDVNYIL